MSIASNIAEAGTLSGFGAKRGRAARRSGRRLRVLHVYSDGGSNGGIERTIERLAAASLRDEELDVSVACTAGGPLEARLRSAGVRAYPLHTTPRLSQVHLRPLDPKLSLSYRRILSAERPDLVHVHIGHWEHLGLRMAAGRLVYSFHGYGSLYQNGWVSDNETGRLRSLTASRSPRELPLRFAKSAIRLMLKSFLATADRLTVVSSPELERLRREGYVPRSLTTDVVPSPVDVATIRRTVAGVDPSEARQRFEVPQGARVIVWFARMEPGKDPETAIAAAERIFDREPNAVLLMAGSGSLEEATRRRADASRHHRRIRLLGALNDVAPLLAIADVALFTSEAEGFGLGLIEAAAAGVPIVTTPVGAALDLFGAGTTGVEVAASPFLAATGDSERFAEKAAALIELPPASRSQGLWHSSMGFRSSRGLVMR